MLVPLPFIDNYQGFFQGNHTYSTIFVRYFKHIHDCNDCRELEKKVSQLDRKTFLLEIREAEPTEIKLRKIAKDWPNYHFILSDYAELRGISRARYDKVKVGKSPFSKLMMIVDGRDEFKI